MRLSKYKLGELIEPCDKRNSDGRYGINDVKGLSIQKKFIETKANMDGVSLKPYILVKPDMFCYVSVTSRNGEKITLAYNCTNDTYIVSSSYIVFKVKRPELLDSFYLFMYFNRSEFDRYSRFNSWGSAREVFSWDDMCDIDIELPDIEIQKKYVAIYKAMKHNLKVYESKLDDLKLVCEGYIEDLRRKYPCESIGKYIEEKNQKNKNNSVSLFQGVNVDHEFTEPKRVADDTGAGTVVYKNQFAFNKVMKSNNTKWPIALRKDDTCVVSGSYQVFEVASKEKLDSDYLMMWFDRMETQRYLGFVSFGTTRDVVTIDDVKSISIPIPNIQIQRNIVQVLNIYKKRKNYYRYLKDEISNICPVLIAGAIKEAKEYA